MSEWPSCITAPNGKWVRLEDFERLLDFAADIASDSYPWGTETERIRIREVILKQLSKKDIPGV